MNGKRVELVVKNGDTIEIVQGLYEGIVLGPLRIKLSEAQVKKGDEMWTPVEEMIYIPKANLTQPITILEDTRGYPETPILQGKEPAPVFPAPNNSDLVASNFCEKPVVNWGLKEFKIISQMDETYDQIMDFILTWDTVYVMIGGVEVSRVGNIDIMALHLNNTNKLNDQYVYVLDMMKWDSRKVWQGKLGRVFSELTCVMHNCRPLADYLDHRHDIQLTVHNIQDTQAMHAVLYFNTNGTWPQKVMPLNSLLQISTGNRLNHMIYTRVGVHEDKLIWTHRPLVPNVIGHFVDGVRAVSDIHMWLKEQFEAPVRNAIHEFLQYPRARILAHDHNKCMELLPGKLSNDITRNNCDCRENMNILHASNTVAISKADSKDLVIKYSRDMFEVQRSKDTEGELTGDLRDLHIYHSPI